MAADVGVGYDMALEGFVNVLSRIQSRGKVIYHSSGGYNSVVGDLCGEIWSSKESEAVFLGRCCDGS